MRTALSLMALLLCLPLNAQRIRENTSSSWSFQNHSIEQYQDMTVTGFTEMNTATGLLSPAFRITPPSGFTGVSYRINHSDALYLMDFTIREGSIPTIILTGMTVATPHRLYLMEVNMMTGALIRHSFENLVIGGTSVIPFQVILSPTGKQVVVVGTMVTGTPSNPTTDPKTGFVLAVNESNFNAVLFIRTTNAPASTSDYDVLEAIAEVPGTGYFITGSVTNGGKQSLYNLGLDYIGTTTHTTVYDNAPLRSVGASVLYNPGTARVYVLSNNDARDGFCIAAFNTAGGIMTPFFIYAMTGTPPGSVQTNGFCLRQVGSQLLVGGYISNPAMNVFPTLLTPFNMTIAPTLTTIISSEAHQSGNNSPLGGYYNESGFPVLYNTPDVIGYYLPGNASYMVNPQTGVGYDLNISPVNALAVCDRSIPSAISTTASTPATTPTISAVPFAPVPWPAGPGARGMSPTYLCGAPPPTMALYPNPATDYIDVQLEGTIAGIAVLGASGADVTDRIQQERTRGNLRLDIGGLTPGVYVLSLTDENGNHYHEKFVKE